MGREDYELAGVTLLIIHYGKYAKIGNGEGKKRKRWAGDFWDLLTYNFFRACEKWKRKWFQG